MHQGLLAAFLAVADLIALVVALWCSYHLWLWSNPQLMYIVQVQFWELLLPNPWMPSLIVTGVAWVLANRLVGLYDVSRMQNSPTIASLLTRATVYMCVFVVVLQFVSTQRYFSRFLVVSFIGLGFFSLLAVRLLFWQLQLRNKRPIAARNVAIFGVGPDANLARERILRHSPGAYRMIGFVAPDVDHPNPEVDSTEILGRVEELPRLVNAHDLHVVVISTRHATRDEALSLASVCGGMGVRVLQVPFTWGFASTRVSLSSLGGLQLIDLQYLSYPSFAENVKRVFDLSVVILGGLALSPLLLVLAAFIKLDSKGPVFFVSERVGKGGRMFPFWKFRSMVQDADGMKDALRDLNETDGRLFKIKNDPRVTRFGRLIRKFSVDELPQLYNVLRGDMNLVGPRPLPVRDLEGIENDPEARYWFELRSKVKPGITGLWQVMGRSDLAFKDMVSLDIDYVQNWSLWLDLQILVKTVPAVLKGRGAA